MKLLFLLLCLMPFAVAAQLRDTSIFAFPVRMDEVTVRAARAGWDVNAFIRKIRQDTTFYKAFRSLHLAAYTADNDIRILDKNGKVAASLKSRTRQSIQDNCRSMNVREETTTGDFYTRRGGYNYYTAELYAYLFFTKGKVCNENDVVNGALNARGSGSLEKSKYQLKQLIFNPGSKVQGVPFMGDRASIFDADVAQRYNFTLQSVDYFGTDAWLFSAVPKPAYKGTRSVVYDEFATWFRKSDDAILARNYGLSFSTAVYDFDVRMKVRLTTAGGRLLPSRIEYDGNWRVVTKGRERAKFVAAFQY